MNDEAFGVSLIPKGQASNALYLTNLFVCAQTGDIYIGVGGCGQQGRAIGKYTRNRTMNAHISNIFSPCPPIFMTLILIKTNVYKKG
jgi:hypothetical protein